MGREVAGEAADDTTGVAGGCLRVYCRIHFALAHRGDTAHAHGTVRGDELQLALSGVPCRRHLADHALRAIYCEGRHLAWYHPHPLCHLFEKIAPEGA